MRGVVAIGAGRLDVQDFPDPTPGPGELVVEMRAAGICGCSREALAWHATDVDPDAPRVVAGHEGAGIVAAVGPDVGGYRVGDRVAIHAYSGCGRCRHCFAGWPQLCADRVMYGTDRNGSWGDYEAVRSEMCIRLPESMSYEVGAACSCSAATAFHALRRLRVVAGETLAIYGVGNIGFATLLLALSMGCRTIAIERGGFRLELAKRLGAWKTIDASTDDPIEGVLSLTRGEGADATFDAGASPSTWNNCIRLTRPRGRCVVVGEHAESGHVDTDAVIRRELEVHGCWSASRSQVADLVDYVSAVGVPLETMITHRFAPDRALDALPIYETLTTGKVEIAWPTRNGAPGDPGPRGGTS